MIHIWTGWKRINTSKNGKALWTNHCAFSMSLNEKVKTPADLTVRMSALTMKKEGGSRMGVSVYQIVTDRIIAELEKGIIPWEWPWTGVRDGAFSRATGKPYSLLNQLLLGKPGEYLTYRQALAAGGQVRKGEKGSIVVFWKLDAKADKDRDTGELKIKQFPILKYYYVFHVDQCDGIEPKYKEPAFTPMDPIEEAERVLADYSTRCGVPIIHEKGNRAFYRPATDEIHLPLMEQFSKQAEYYSVAFHESVHSTGHKSRLNRLDDNSRFGNEVYSKEELVSEMGAACILHELGIETDSSFRNSAAYIQSWLHALKDDPKMVVHAAGKAEKAVKLILNVREDAGETVGNAQAA